MYVERTFDRVHWEAARKRNKSYVSRTALHCTINKFNALSSSATATLMIGTHREERPYRTRFRGPLAYEKGAASENGIQTTLCLWRVAKRPARRHASDAVPVQLGYRSDRYSGHLQDLVLLFLKLG
jgi:hypothetical protein